MRKINYRHANIEFYKLRNKISLPKFQRSLVWSMKNKKRFIDTVLKGDPFGVLLLYEDVITRNYIVIDGLQRYTTLLDFSKNPYKYIDFNTHSSTGIENIAKIILQEYPNSGEEHVYKQLTSYYKEVLKEYLLRRDDDDFTYVPNKLFDNITKIYGSLTREAKNMIRNELLNFWNSQKNFININHLEIPIILYEGSFENLPEIFERLNTGGTKLSKYEVYSSSWSNITLDLINNKKNKRVLEHVEKKYKQLIKDTEIEITNYEPKMISNSGKITLYEYVYGLGKEIINQSRVLTGNRSVSYGRDDSIGFSTAATIYNLHLKDLDKLTNFLNKNYTPQQFENLTAIILKSYREVNEILKPYIEGNTKYVEAQIISIVHTWFRLNFELKGNGIVRIASDLKLINKFYEYMPMRLLYDVLNNYWAGSGDNKLYEIISSDLNNNRYLRPISIESWKSLLEDWIEEQNNKVLTTVPSEIRMFLSYITKKEKGIRYTRNTIILKQQLDSDVNFGHLGNVFLAPGNKRFNSNKAIKSKDDIEEQYHIPDYIIFGQKNKYTKEEYENFVNERSQQLVKAFFQKYYNFN